MARKDKVRLAGLDNIDVAGKQAMVETVVLAATVITHLGMQCLQNYEFKWMRCNLKWRFVQRFSDSTWKAACAQTLMCRHIV